MTAGVGSSGGGSSRNSGDGCSTGLSSSSSMFTTGRRGPHAGALSAATKDFELPQQSSQQHESRPGMAEAREICSRSSSRVPATGCEWGCSSIGDKLLLQKQQQLGSQGIGALAAAGIAAGAASGAGMVKSGRVAGPAKQEEPQTAAPGAPQTYNLTGMLHRAHCLALVLLISDAVSLYIAGSILLLTATVLWCVTAWL